VHVPSFDSIVDLARVMRGYPHPWFISGGWAIDLFVGRVTREHEDLEVGACFPHQDALRGHLSDWRLARIRSDAWESWQPGDTIALPEFQAQARSDRLAPHVFDIFLNPLDGDDWVSRRHPDLRMPMAELVGRTMARADVPHDVPYLVPEVQLLYKAKYHRPKDDADFDAAVGHMTRARRRWLRDALEVHHPGDPWIQELRRPR
jgi:hypothetical protein